LNSKEEQILNTSVQYIKTVGPKRAESFRKIGIRSIKDLLFYFPTRHLDRTTTLTAAKAYGYIMNGYEGELTVIAQVNDKERKRFGRKEIMNVQFRDSTGFFECVWFQGIKYFYDTFREGDTFAVSGKPSLSKYGNLQFVHPDYDRITEDESRGFLNTGKIIPFYRLPKELKATNIGDFSLRRIINSAVENFADHVSETLNENVVRENSLLSLKEAVKNIHFPLNKEGLESAKYRFKFEELFFLEILVALRKKNYQRALPGRSLKVRTNLISDFLKILPFELTKAQLRVLSEIRKDMESPKPMNRLLQGDVGSGKTIVALIAMLIAVDNGYQAALMAPTEILADQHAKNISKMMNKLSEIHKGRKVKVTLLIGGQKKSLKEKNLEQIELQEAEIIIGTHALFEEKVKFKNLGLVIVDEQHRFGVAQRARLIAKSPALADKADVYESPKAPDVIVMSATPIPRTLSMTLYGDLDSSVIDEMPKSRKPVKTYLRGESKLPQIYKFIFDRIKSGYQSFIVYPLVEESEKLELKAAESYYNQLTASYLKNIKVGLIHGRMSWQEKEEKMFLFLNKKFDVLISTTVIEVGIDIPDANIMVVNDAHRFGLSQLHQLRGRIGRGIKQAYCILVTKDKYVSVSEQHENEIEFLSPAQLENYKATLRLQAMVKHNDGFKISDIDLKLRGPGNIFGIEQSGFPELKYADIVKDSEIISKAKDAAFKLMEADPDLKLEVNRSVKIKLIENYSESYEYSKIA
jgi:ATP-dependent DNA helicase RecG